jgi:hypothetical protein
VAEQGAAGSAGTDSGTAPNENGGQGNGLHESFISSAPEHLRDAARELVPFWDPYVQRQFTDNANYRKQWQPYEELGINELDPQDLQELLEFRNIVQDEDAFRQWHEEVGNLLGDPEESEQQDGSELPPELQKFMQDYYADKEQQQAQQAFTESAAQVRQELNALKPLAEQAGLEMTEEVEDDICTLALKYDTPDAIQKGFADYQRLVGKGEQGVFNNKTDPALRVAPVSGGNNNNSVEPVTTFEQAARAARERLRHSE